MNPSNPREMLDKLSNNSADRQCIEEFIEWLAEKELPNVQLIDIHLSKRLDEYHGIDRKQLEEERRALLDHQRALTAAANKAMQGADLKQQ